ncbi:exopolygalacturonase PelB [Actinomadura viridis]|uniref:Polygalacturonase n=1 Tax=Actinomadura viridis TaxID=58110 RepID=A0A931GNP4_9ACTN|nr:glycoside hydrolase family 28 protein [Actinomadura viridis]MBG6093992.1 polygalacturonase [Actinomadura viridis]
MRRILTVLVAVLLAAAAVPGAAAARAEPGTSTTGPAVSDGTAQGWKLADRIRHRVRPPKIPVRKVVVTDFGADPTGTRESTAAFRKAIAAAAGKGGGRVVVPAGTFLTGAIHLRSGIDLHLAEGSVVKFSQDPADYLPAVYTRWEGVELYNYSPFVYARKARNVAITGSGTLDGQADATHWWNWAGATQTADRAELFRMGESGVPVEQRRFGGGHYLRPNFVQFYESENILVQGVKIVGSPMWMVHPVLSRNVLVDRVTLESHGPNNDGVNPESSRDVVIRDSAFDNGDDCIAIKSGRNADGRRVNVPSENIVVHGNTMRDGHGGVVIGSEMSGSVRNVFAEDNVMDSPNLDRALRIKTNSVRGGVVENVYFRDNEVLEVGQEVIWINFFYEEGDAGAFTPTVRGVHVEDLKSNGGQYALYLRGYERSPISDVTITNATFDNVGTPMLLEHVRDLRLTNVLINGEPYDD